MNDENTMQINDVTISLIFTKFVTTSDYVQIARLSEHLLPGSLGTGA